MQTDFNGQVVVQNYLKRTGREEWAKQVTKFVAYYLIVVSFQPMNGQLLQNFLKIDGVLSQFREAAKRGDDSAMLNVMSNYGMSQVLLLVDLSQFYAQSQKLNLSLIIVAGEEVVTALGSEVDRLEKEIQELVPGIQHVDIEAHNPIDQSL